MNQTREEKYKHFIKRPFMYISNTDLETVVAFVHGFEIGTGEQYLTNSMTKFLEEEHKITKYATGWVGQLNKYAERKKTTFFEAFKEIVLELFD